MSHAHGEIIVGGKVVGFYEYGGTSDVCHPAIFDTREELVASWRKTPWRQCKCAAPTNTPALIYTDYGYGFYWPGEVCMTCKTITKNLGSGTEQEVEERQGHPLIESHRPQTSPAPAPSASPRSS